FPTDHEVGVVEPFVGQEARVRAAHDGDATVRAHLVGEPVRLGRRGGDGRNADQIGGEHFLHVDGVNVLDVDADLVAFVSHERAEENRTEAGDTDPAVHVQVRGFRLYENKFLQRTFHRWDLLSHRGSQKLAQR